MQLCSQFSFLLEVIQLCSQLSHLLEVIQLCSQLSHLLEVIQLCSQLSYLLEVIQFCSQLSHLLEVIQLCSQLSHLLEVIQLCSQFSLLLEVIHFYSQLSHHMPSFMPNRARIVNNFLQLSGIQRIEWPPMFPDLSCIEHLWDILGRAVNKHINQKTRLAELQRPLQDWAAIPQRQIQGLVNLMRRRLNECRMNLGGYTHY